MKNLLLIIIISIYSTVLTAENKCFRICASWDTFCKNPAQIVATKCRLGVPVKNEQCAALGLRNANIGHSLVEGLPCSTSDGISTMSILNPYLK